MFCLFYRREFRDLKERNLAEVSICKDYIIGRENNAVHRRSKLEMLVSRDYLSTGSHSCNKLITFIRDFYIKKIAVITKCSNSGMLVSFLFKSCPYMS